MQKFTVKIVGKEFTIIGRDDEERVRDVAKIVENEYLNVDKAYPTLSISDKAFLTAMTITDNSFSNSNANVIKQQQEKINTLVNDIIDLKEDIKQANNVIANKQDDNDVLKIEIEEKDKIIADLKKYLDDKEQEIDNIANDSLNKQRELVKMKEYIQQLHLELDEAKINMSNGQDLEVDDEVEQDLSDTSNEDDIVMF